MAAMSGIQILQDPMRADRAVISIAPFPQLISSTRDLTQQKNPAFFQCFPD